MQEYRDPAAMPALYYQRTNQPTNPSFSSDMASYVWDLNARMEAHKATPFRLLFPRIKTLPTTGTMRDSRFRTQNLRESSEPKAKAEAEVEVGFWLLQQ